VLEREFDQLIRRTAFTNLRDLVSRFGELLSYSDACSN
jgi:hypothetical protein